MVFDVAYSYLSSCVDVIETSRRYGQRIIPFSSPFSWLPCSSCLKEYFHSSWLLTGSFVTRPSPPRFRSEARPRHLRHIINPAPETTGTIHMHFQSTLRHSEDGGIMLGIYRTRPLRRGNISLGDNARCFSIARSSHYLLRSRHIHFFSFLCQLNIWPAIAI
jgi:hypothetical protein